MKTRCIVIPALKKNAVIPDQLVKKLAGITLIDRALATARAVAKGSDIYVLTDSQEISLICERAGVQFHCNAKLRFTTYDIVSEMRELLEVLAQEYEHCLIYRPSCPLLTWVDLEACWQKYLLSGADTLVTVKEVHQRLYNLKNGTLAHLLTDTDERFMVESRAVIVLKLATLAQKTPPPKVVPYLLDERAIEIQGYQDWWICERLLLRRTIVFVVAGYPAIGMGHVYRALMLAHEITNHKITFVCTRESALAVENIALRDYPVVRQGQEALATTVMQQYPDLVINDFLNTTSAYMQTLTENGIRCVNFEDDGEGANFASLVINALYENRPSTAKFRFGPAYFCLRDEFLAASRNPFRSTVQTVLLTFGGTDQKNCLKRCLDLLAPICHEKGIALRLVAGPGYAHKEAMEAELCCRNDPTITFTAATNVMSRMMEGVDLAISSAGRTVYELAHMRIPSLVLAHHEREAKHTFARHKNGFVFVGLMDRVSDAKIRNCFLAMLDSDRRLRYWARQNALDFSPNKARVIGLILDLLEGEDL